jgi:signal transduction histidine kinase
MNSSQNKKIANSSIHLQGNAVPQTTTKVTNTARTSKSDDTLRADVVLIVDDTTYNLEILFATLQYAGFTVLVAQDGVSALAKAEYAEPDIILLDILMPGMDGFEVCRKLKGNRKTKDIPILFMTALDNPENILKGFELGGVDYVTKPIEQGEVIARLKTHLKLRRMQEHLQAQNEQLEQEIRIRQQTETQLERSQQLLQQTNQELEQRIAERTAELVYTNKQLEKMNAELVCSNQELEKFAYVVSHDLQAPLRSIKMFAELLAQEYKDKLNSQADEYLDYITDSAERMQTLIKDLLAYCRAGKNEQTWISVDLKDVINNVLRDLEASIQESKARIKIERLPTVQANPREINQLFQNLISNGIKFRGKDTPRIEINAQSQQQQWLISVKDNGIGIESQYQDKIFQIFQRLHSLEEYPGTGVGLAICQKIVERHGGSIWVESQPNRGSTFYFTLPQKEFIQQHQAFVYDSRSKKVNFSVE